MVRLAKEAKVAKVLEGHEVFKRKLTRHLGIRRPVINFLPFMCHFYNYIHCFILS